MDYVLGIDIGTGGAKTVLFDRDLRAVASAAFEYPLSQPQPLWAEQDPEDWYAAVVRGIRACLEQSGISPELVRGVGLSGQMHGLVLLDQDGRVLRPAILWCDQRTQEECEELTRAVGRERLIEITANPALTGFTAGKILWVRKHEPEIFARAAHILLPKDYVRFRLTGEFATEVSDASGMQLMDIANRCWSPEMCRSIGVRTEQLGKMYESCEVTGAVTEDAAQATGLRAGTRVVGGAGDQAASAIGNGIVREGLVSDTIGTSGVVFAHTERPLIDPRGRVHTFCHAVRNKWHVMGVTQGAGLSLKWFRDRFCAEESALAAGQGRDVYDLLTERASEVPAGCEGLLFLPYLMGERTPHLNPAARGVFFGLTNAHTRRHLLRSVLEGVMFSQLDCLDILKELGVSAAEIRMSGGGARSDFWRQMFADGFGSDVTTVGSAEGGALGVAILAGVGTGLFSDVESACARTVRTVTRLHPDASLHRTYRAAHQKYRRLYDCLKGEF